MLLTNRTKDLNKLTKGAVLCSTTVILFVLCKILTFIDVTLLSISSCIMCLSIIKIGARSSVLVLISSTIVSAILGLIEYSLIYFLFFGIYPLLKYFIEFFKNVVIEFFLKILYFNSLIFLSFFIHSRAILPIFIYVPMSFLIIFYDLILTKFIQDIYDNALIDKL